MKRVQKAKHAKIVLGCPTLEDRYKVKERLETGHLRVEKVKNLDPKIVLRDLLNVNSNDNDRYSRLSGNRTGRCLTASPKRTTEWRSGSVKKQGAPHEPPGAVSLPHHI